MMRYPGDDDDYLRQLRQLRDGDENDETIFLFGIGGIVAGTLALIGGLVWWLA